MKIIAIQVIPYSEKEPGVINAQLAGPDANTVGWGIYQRFEGGSVVPCADTFDESIAWDIGCMLAEKHGVEIEPQPWRTK